MMMLIIIIYIRSLYEFYWQHVTQYYPPYVQAIGDYNQFPFQAFLVRTAATHPTRLRNKSGQRADETSCMVNSHLVQRNVLGYGDTVFLAGGYPRLKLTVRAYSFSNGINGMSTCVRHVTRRMNNWRELVLCFAAHGADYNVTLNFGVDSVYLDSNTVNIRGKNKTAICFSLPWYEVYEDTQKSGNGRLCCAWHEN